MFYHEWSICKILNVRADLNYIPSNLNAITSRVGSRVRYSSGCTLMNYFWILSVL